MLGGSIEITHLVLMQMNACAPAADAHMPTGGFSWPRVARPVWLARCSLLDLHRGSDNPKHCQRNADRPNRRPFAREIAISDCDDPTRRSFQRPFNCVINVSGISTPSCCARSASRSLLLPGRRTASSSSIIPMSVSTRDR